jgi:hypothetical protein
METITVKGIKYEVATTREMDGGTMYYVVRPRGRHGYMVFCKNGVFGAVSKVF